MDTITQATTDPTTGNQFISKTLFEEWADNYTANQPAVYEMSSDLLDDLDDDFLGNTGVVAVSFYFGIQSGSSDWVLLLAGTKDSGEDVFDPDKVYYLKAGETAPQTTTSSNAATWVNAYKTTIGGSYTEQTPGALIFYKGYFNNLRNQTGVATVKVFRGVDDSQNNVLMLAAADSQGDILENLTYQYLERSRPCPPFPGCGKFAEGVRDDHQF
ncbi:MAG: hypothetical protein KF734_01265 [Saprospiraceae bacterium]|nr:hypothetical protein [Saprospiraceae bacterium]